MALSLGTRAKRIRRVWLGPRLETFEDRTVPSGGLDLTFDTDGKASTDFGFFEQATAVAVQTDGKIIAVGGANTPGGLRVAIARYQTNGTLDNSFDGDGRIILSFPFAGNAGAADVALQPDGKIVVVGAADPGGDLDFLLVRLNANGSFDTSLASEGWRIIDFGGMDIASGVAVQNDGKIIIVGQTDVGSPLVPDFAVARVNANGSVDTSFSGDGLYTTGFGAYETASSVALQTDGKLVIAGSTHPVGGPANFALTRLNANGTNDTSFDTDGQVTIDFGDDDRATGIVVQPDGKIVVGGYGAVADDDFALARLNTNGGLDTSFNATSMPTMGNGNGKLSFPFSPGTTEQARAVALQPDGKIVLVGYFDYPGAADDFAVARVNPNGTLDWAFDDDGRRTVNFGGDDQGTAIALQPDGRIILAGYTVSGGDANFALARLIGANVQFAAVGGAPGRVEIYARDGKALGAFFPYAASGYVGGVAIALGDVNSDGIDDLITAATIGNPHTKVYDGSTMESGGFFANTESHLMVDGFPYAINFNVGVNVAAGDVNGDGFADIITGAVPGNPHVRVFDGYRTLINGFIPTEFNSSVLAEGFAYGVNFNIGANVASGDVNGDGLSDIITGPSAGNPHTKVFNAAAILATRVIPTESNSSLLSEFFPYAINFNVGAFVAVADYNRDGFGDVITGASIGNPEVRMFNGRDIAKGTFNLATSLIEVVYAFELGQNIGISVAAADLANDGWADVLTATRNGTPRYRAFQNNFPLPASLMADITNPAFTGPLYVAA